MRFTGTADCNPTRIHAQGGNGGSTTGTNAGPGGGGGGGRILFQACGGGTCVLPTSSVNGGTPGLNGFGTNGGATAGANGVLTVLSGCYSPLNAPVVLTPANGSSTNNPRPIYSGTLAQPFPAGTEVIIYVDGVELTRVTPDASGNWSFTQPTNLTEGSHSVYAVAINTSQNLQSIPSNTNTFTVDLTPPPAPIVIAPANGSTTNDNTPVYSGTAEANSTVSVIVDGSLVGTAVTNASGTWSLTPATPLADGAHTVRATAMDAAGNTSVPSAANTFIVDTTPPAAPVVLTPANGSITSDNTPTYRGTAEPGISVTVIVDGTPVGMATANASGVWSFTLAAPLADGSHTVSATASDAAGNTSPSSAANTFIVDTTPPAAPVVLTPANGSRTNDNTPTYTGTAEPNSSVKVIVDGATVATVMADASGNWSFIPTTPLTDGSHTVRATATDAAGNTSVSSATNTFIVDTTPPAAPVVLTPANGSITSDNTPTYSGTAEANSLGAVIVDGATVVTVTADVSGNWSFIADDALADGSHTVRATATDAAGNTSVSSTTNTFIVDTTPPAAPVVLTPANGSITNDNTPTYSGTAEANSTVSIIVDGSSVVTVTANASGVWSFTPAAPLADGSHTVRATATDATGNTSASSATDTFIVDTTPPAAPVVLTPANGSRTSNTTPTYSGTAEANSTVSVIVDGSLVGTVIADASGNWSLTRPALADGSHTVRATATDAAGNTSASSATNTFIVDTTPPAAPVVTAPANGSRTNDTTPTYTGTAEPNSTVSVIVDGDSDGPRHGECVGQLELHADDAADGRFAHGEGHGDGCDAATPARRRPPTRSSWTPRPRPHRWSRPLPTGRGPMTPRRPDSGTAEPNSTVSVIVDGNPVTTVTADAAGSWSYTSATPLTEGSHTVRATATDAAGNTSVPSATNTFIVDTTPAAPVVTAPADGSTTSDSTPTYTGTAEPNSTVSVIVDGTPMGPVTADASGNWTTRPWCRWRMALTR